MKRIAIGLFCFALAPAGVILAAAGRPARAQCTVSGSKLSIHLIRSYTPGAQQIVAQGPRVLKVLDLGGAMRAALRDYKERFPDGTTVVRLFDGTHRRYTLDEDPESSAEDYWNRVLFPPLSNLPEEDRRLIDYLEGPNEGDSTPDWSRVESARWLGRFHARLAAVIAAHPGICSGHGFRPCVGSIAVGNPPGTLQEIEDKLEQFVPALQAAQQAGGAWSYHAYTLPYTMDPAVEVYYSLRYRRFYDFLRRQHPDLAELPLILTEGGVDSNGDPRTSGWQARGDVPDDPDAAAAKFQSWLAWFDGQLQSDPYVVGVTLFESGDPGGWPSFELEPVACWIAQHLSMAPVARAPSPILR